jgi:hypothetical protein
MRFLTGCNGRSAKIGDLIGLSRCSLCSLGWRVIENRIMILAEENKLNVNVDFAGKSISPSPMLSPRT